MQREERGYENRLHANGPIDAGIAGWDLGATDTRSIQGGGTISDSIPEHQHMHLSRELGGGCG